MTQQDLDATRQRFEAEMKKYEFDLDEDERLNLQAPASIRQMLAIMDELVAQWRRADTKIEAVQSDQPFSRKEKP